MASQKIRNVTNVTDVTDVLACSMFSWFYSLAFHALKETLLADRTSRPTFAGKRLRILCATPGAVWIMTPTIWSTNHVLNPKQQTSKCGTLHFSGNIGDDESMLINILGLTESHILVQITFMVFPWKNEADNGSSTSHWTARVFF